MKAAQQDDKDALGKFIYFNTKVVINLKIYITHVPNDKS